MSNIRILYILISDIIFIYLTSTAGTCKLSSNINLQWAAYTHSLILHVKTMDASERIDKNKSIVMGQVPIE